MNTIAVVPSRLKKTVGTAKCAARAGKPPQKLNHAGAAGGIARGSLSAPKKEKFSIYPLCKPEKIRYNVAVKI